MKKTIRRLKNLTLAFILFSSGPVVFSQDLFVNGKLRSISPGSLITKNDTIGGYPIYQDDERWTFVNGRESESTGSSRPIKMGTVLMDYKEGTYLLARQSITAAVDPGGFNSNWTGSPCSPEHLVVRNKGAGLNDNCLTIDPFIVNVGSKPTMFFSIVLTNTAGNGRYYKLTLYVNADLLGVRDTGLGDWSKEEVKSKPYKQEVINRLTLWAEQLQDGSIKALGFSKPQDVYNKIPSLMTLLPVPPDLVNKKYSASFLSAVEHIRHQPKFSSIAYSHYEDHRTGWHFFTGRPTQEVADEAALSMCETTRKNSRPSAPNCVIYKRVENITKSAVVDVNSGAGLKKPTENDVALKLEKLKELYSKGLINKEQYDSQVKEELGKL
jgi:hypothetical protein